MGAGWADYDNDGEIDLFTAKNNYFGGSDNALYRNDGTGNNWLWVRCVGTVSNRSAIGARAKVITHIHSGAIYITREISSQTGGGTSGQSSLLASFGLGDASIVDTLVVNWPSGIVQTLTAVAVNQILTVTEPQTGMGGRVNSEERREKVAASVIRSLPAGAVAFDATGRRVSNPKPGVYFVTVDGARSTVHVRKVVITR
jgi:hypothetical protein